MRVSRPGLEGLVVFEPPMYRDARGVFRETYRADAYSAEGLPQTFVQHNVSTSAKHVLRGLHSQYPVAQGKLVYILEGEVYDVAVDARVGSSTFGKWHAEILSCENGRQMYVPPGCLHGFVVLSERAIVAYLCSEYYAPSGQLSIRWNDPDIGIPWPVADPILSEKDRAAPCLHEIPVDYLVHLS